ncbi:hypothetical protein ElyMa_000047400 [Elysia marginata]|uniref:Uncharacterized protein n=1 Tax=Elysia marginata TaxID=1093978 RepID=A0AAV4EDE1_9GAST|nr:hypothetical protein ElyMa_000047400 [Elysia marginata]
MSQKEKSDIERDITFKQTIKRQGKRGKEEIKVIVEGCAQCLELLAAWRLPTASRRRFQTRCILLTHGLTPACSLVVVVVVVVVVVAVVVVVVVVAVVVVVVVIVLTVCHTLIITMNEQRKLVQK